MTSAEIRGWLATVSAVLTMLGFGGSTIFAAYHYCRNNDKRTEAIVSNTKAVNKNTATIVKLVENSHKLDKRISIIESKLAK